MVNVKVFLNSVIMLAFYLNITCPDKLTHFTPNVMEHSEIDDVLYEDAELGEKGMYSNLPKIKRVLLGSVR